MKACLKTLWISFLSTIIKIIAQMLTTEGFKDINTIKVAFTEAPIEYFIINFCIFIALTVLFILINQQLPVFKLLKGFVFAFMVGIIWTALRFQPNVLENFAKYIYDVVTFLIPMIIYGAFLGYLAKDKTKDFKYSKNMLLYFAISLGWLLLHFIYIIIMPPAKSQIFNYIIWVIFAAFVIGITFGFFYEIHLKTKNNAFFMASIAVFVVFISYYAYQFSLNNEFDIKLVIKVLLDIVSVIISLLFIELYLNRVKNLQS